MSGPTMAAVVPVHDEEALLGACLRSVVAAAERARSAGAGVRVVVVLDACGDGSGAIASRFPVETAVIAARNVGAARRAGCALALRPAPGRGGPDWIAHTDADSVVPPNWLTHQLELMGAGADVMVGTVRPDFADLSPRHVAQWQATHLPGRPNGHVHGANLGIRASLYRAIGGFAAIPEHEDVALVAAARAAGAAVTATDACEVLTSGRLLGRTPGGYAGHLRDQRALLDAGQGAAGRDEALIA